MMPSKRLLPLAVSIGLIFSHTAWAQEAPAEGAEGDAATELETIQVTGRRTAPATTERTTAADIQREMIRSNRDLVRYSPDVGVADQGRHSKGFAIRGVEDNRVGISIDGVALPDSEENSLYKRYGNINTSRQSIDPELARTIDVVKGADSFNQGSGNLGGGVNYRTLNASDIVRDGNQAGFLWRSGYASRNEEWTNTAGFGYQGESAEAVLLYSHRRGHEMESAGGYTVPEDSLMTRERRNSRQIPDDAKHHQHSFLAKLAWRFNPSHRVGINFSGQQGNNYIIEDSGVTNTDYYREADDRAKRRTGNVFYEFTPDSKWLALLKVDADWQKTVSSAYNYEGTREGVDFWGRWSPKTPSDTNIRILNTDMKRLSFRMDTQPLRFLSMEHTLSFKASGMEKEFSAEHFDRVYLSGIPQPWRASTMMYPVKTRQFFLSLHDRIKFNDTFSGFLGLRYDHAKVQPQDLGGLSCRECLVPKPADASFKGWSWVLGADAQLNDNWKIGYSIGTGFRIPNASEMYFDYRDNAAGGWMSNPNLKAERSLSQSLNLTGTGRAGDLSVSLHHTRYKDFLYEQEKWDNFTYTVWSSTYSRWRPVQQMQNIDSAQVYGLEASGRLNLNSISALPEGWKLFGSLGWSKGTLDNGADLLSIQPLKAIIGLDYEAPSGKWGVYSRLTYMGRKKPQDAEYLKAVEDRNRCMRYETIPDPWGGPPITRCAEHAHYVETQAWPHLNKPAWVFDLYGFYKPTENLTLRAGVYNLFNQKYHTWDTLRGLNTTGGVVNSVGVRPNTRYGGYPGLERFYAPGRNFAVSLEYKF